MTSPVYYPYGHPMYGSPYYPMQYPIDRTTMNSTQVEYLEKQNEVLRQQARCNCSTLVRIVIRFVQVLILHKKNYKVAVVTIPIVNVHVYIMELIVQVGN